MFSRAIRQLFPSIRSLPFGLPQLANVSLHLAPVALGPEVKTASAPARGASGSERSLFRPLEGLPADTASSASFR